ncbi:MAG: VanZ family protein [Phycisphaerales bacterium]
MTLSREKKFFTSILLFYWLSLLIATHIPVPDWVRVMGVSDKTMHFAAYMVLTILIWLASSFDMKASWKTFRPLLVLAFVLFYGFLDELSQKFFAGRSADLLDLFSDLMGISAGLLLATFISGYHLTMILIAIAPVFLPAIVHAKIIKYDSILETSMYVVVFCMITFAWGQYLNLILRIVPKTFKSICLFVAMPIASLIFVIVYAHLTNKPIGSYAISQPFGAIALIAFTQIMIIRGRRFDKAH